METHRKFKKQRQPLYNAESIIGGTLNILPNLSRLKKEKIYLKWTDMEMVKNPDYIGYEATNKLVNKIVKEKIYNKSFYKRYFRPIRIDCKGNEGACRYHGTFITLKTWADDSVLLHELAHQYGNDHDSRFATAYLMLVGKFLGHDQQIKLMDNMRKYNVEWNGTFQHSKKCFTEHGYTDRAKNAGGQCTTGATKMNLGFKTRYLH